MQFVTSIFAQFLIPILAAAGVGVILALRHFDRKASHRSILQMVIYAMYWVARWQYSVIRGIDAGYVAYRRTLSETRLDIENERELGLLIPQIESEQSFSEGPGPLPRALRNIPAARSGSTVAPYS